MLNIYLVITPGVLMLDCAGPAEALRMAQEMGAPLTMHTCGPVSEVPTSLGLQLAGLTPLPVKLPTRSLVLLTGNAREQEDYATPAAQQVVQWLRSAPRTDTRLASICSGALLLAQGGSCGAGVAPRTTAWCKSCALSLLRRRCWTTGSSWKTARCSPVPASPPASTWPCTSCSRRPAPSWPAEWRGGW